MQIKTRRYHRIQTWLGLLQFCFVGFMDKSNGSSSSTIEVLIPGMSGYILQLGKHVLVVCLEASEFFFLVSQNWLVYLSLVQISCSSTSFCLSMIGSVLFVSISIFNNSTYSSVSNSILWFGWDLDIGRIERRNLHSCINFSITECKSIRNLGSINSTYELTHGSKVSWLKWRVTVVCDSWCKIIIEKSVKQQ